MNRIAIMCCILLIMLGLAACALVPATVPQTQPATVVSTPQSSPVQEKPASPAVQPDRKILFQDDFKNPNSGWRVFANDFGEGKYENGSYLLKCVRPSYIKYEVYTANSALPSLSSFVLDMDVTMLSGDKNDRFGVLLKWPDINPMGVEGYVQPSDYYFIVSPVGMTTWVYSKQQVKGSSVDKEPGYFVRAREYTCVKGINAVNNIKITFNPGIRFLVNDYELVNAPDEDLGYVNRLIKEKTMAGAELQVIADSQDQFSSPVFQLNRIAVYANN